MSEIKQKTPYELGLAAGKISAENHADTPCPDFSNEDDKAEWYKGFVVGFNHEVHHA